MTEGISVVVPARNEAATIQDVIGQMSRLGWVDEIVVVDNGSTDGTGEAAFTAGARAIHEARPGMGHALRTGIEAARNDWVMKVDADLDGFDTARFAQMVAARTPGTGLVKGHWHDPLNNMLMTRLLVRPSLRRLLPSLAEVTAPNSGIYLFDRSLIACQEITGSFAADLDIMLRIHAAGARVTSVDIGQLSHSMRDLDHYGAQAETIMGFLLDVQENRLSEEIVVFADRARDVIGAGLGLFAKRARAGALVTIFLDQPDDRGARILKDALATYPTLRILLATLAASMAPAGPERRVCLFGPFPAGHNRAVLQAALAFRMRLQSDRIEVSALLLMPVESAGEALSHFRADFAFDVTAGLSIRQRACDRIAALGDGSVPAFGNRETFQSFGALPAALRQDLTGVPAEARPTRADGTG